MGMRIGQGSGLVAFICAMSIGSSSHAQPTAAGTIDGMAPGSVYDSDFNDLTITSWNAEGVRGAYAHEGGRIEGRANGNRVSGYWYQDAAAVGCDRERGGTAYYGRFIFTFSPDLGSFRGLWSHCDEAPDRKWDGTRR